MEQNTLAKRLIEALSNTEALPAPANLESVSDAESELGTASPAFQGLHNLLQELLGEVHEAHKLGHKKLDTCIGVTLKNQLEALKELSWILLRDEFRNEKSVHDPRYAIGIRADWKVVAFEDNSSGELERIMGMTIMMSVAGMAMSGEPEDA